MKNTPLKWRLNDGFVFLLEFIFQFLMVIRIFNKKWLCVSISSCFISIQFIKIANADLLIMYKAVEREMVCVCVCQDVRERERDQDWITWYDS